MANNKIYLGNLSKSVTPAQAEAQLREHFSQYGEINEVLLPVDRAGGEIKGYGFISFAEESSAQSALAHDGQTLFGEAVTVQIATEKKRGKKKP
ncbi:MAG: RNA-binding protein [Gammaproteobacteria bacterium]|nr:RNA-binding protein [Gammaproteobacteria bacterium]